MSERADPRQSGPTVEEVRAALKDVLGEERLAGLRPDEPLLQSGRIGSLDLVRVLAALERRFGVKVAPAQVGRAAEGSLLGLTRLLAGGPRAAPPAAPPGRLLASFRRFLRRPLRGLLLCLAAFALLDQALTWALLRGPLSGRYDAFLERGQRLYPGLGRLSHDDFAAAVEHHEVRRVAGPVVLVLGDSGTVGSYLDAEEAWPARTEQALRRDGVALEVANLGFYGRLLAKDLMLLDLAWDAPLEWVVFTVGDDTLHRGLNEYWVRNYRHISLNWPHLARFLERLPAAERAQLVVDLAALQAADRSRLGWLRRAWVGTAGLPRHAPWIEHELTRALLPRALGSPLRWDDERIETLRWGLDPVNRREMRVGMPRDQFDPRLLQVLRSAIALLAQRGVRTVLFIEPTGPREWRSPLPPGFVSGSDALRALARETGCVLVDQEWALGGGEFLDYCTHYTPEGHRRLGEALAAGIRGAR